MAGEMAAWIIVLIVVAACAAVIICCCVCIKCGWCCDVEDDVGEGTTAQFGDVWSTSHTGGGEHERYRGGEGEGGGGGVWRKGLWRGLWMTE